MKIKTMNLLAIAIGLVGIYYIYDFGKKKGWFDKKSKEVGLKKDEYKTGGEGSIPDKKQPTNNSTSKNNYIVTISSGTLNVRLLPNATSKILSKLIKGQEIYAQPSKVAGWHEILDSKSSFPLVVGYVSSKYVKAK
jgi:hypothetical protein